VTETLTTREAAERVGVPISTFHNWVSAGRIAPVKQLPGTRGAYLFAPEAVEALRAEHIEQVRQQLAELEAS
jgi:excisionase family DNA binding protein